MKLSFAVLCTVAMGAFALPATVPREASGRLAIKAIRPDDILARDVLSLIQRGQITREPRPQRDVSGQQINNP